MREVMPHGELRLPPLGMGAAALGGLFRKVDAAMAAETLAATLDAGIRYIDTAPHYGRGLSERRVGDAVRDRHSVLLSTKVGRLMHPDASITDDRERDGFHSAMPFSSRYDYTRDGVMRSFEDSLQRLGLARVNLLFVHDIGTMIHGERNARHWRELTDGGGFDALCELRRSGAIDGFGIGVNEIEVCLDAIRAAPLDVIMLAGRYTLLEQEPLERLFPACLAAGVKVISAAPYNSGILAAGTRGGGHYNYQRVPADIVARVSRIEEVAAAHDVTLAAAALRFPLGHPAVATVVPGISSPAHAHKTRAWFDQPIPDAFWADLRTAGLIRPDAPSPPNP